MPETEANYREHNEIKKDIEMPETEANYREHNEIKKDIEGCEVRLKHIELEVAKFKAIIVVMVIVGNVVLYPLIKILIEHFFK